MAPSEHLAILQGWAGAISAGDLDGALTYLAPDFVGHFTAMPDAVKGPEGFKGMYSYFIQPAFPDQKITIERDLVAGDRIARPGVVDRDPQGTVPQHPGDRQDDRRPGHRRSSASQTARSPRRGCSRTSSASTSSSPRADGAEDPWQTPTTGRPAAATTTRSSTRAISPSSTTVFTADYVSHHNDPAHLPAGPEGVKAFITMTRQGFPDLKLTVDDIFGDGDLVASRGRWTGPTRASGSARPRPASRPLVGRRHQPVRGRQDRRGLVQLRPDAACSSSSASSRPNLRAPRGSQTPMADPLTQEQIKGFVDALVPGARPARAHRDLLRDARGPRPRRAVPRRQHQ